MIIENIQVNIFVVLFIFFFIIKQSWRLRQPRELIWRNYDVCSDVKDVYILIIENNQASTSGLDMFADV